MDNHGVSIVLAVAGAQVGVEEAIFKYRHSVSHDEIVGSTFVQVPTHQEVKRMCTSVSLRGCEA